MTTVCKVIKHVLQLAASRFAAELTFASACDERGVAIPRDELRLAARGQHGDEKQQGCKRRHDAARPPKDGHHQVLHRHVKRFQIMRGLFSF